MTTKKHINIAKAALDGAFSGNEKAFEQFIDAVNIHYANMRQNGFLIQNAADPNLAGKPDVALVTTSTGEVGMPDFGFRRLFDHIDLTSSTSTTFEALDVSNGVMFEQLEPNQPSKTRRITSNKTSVGFLQYGAGLAILDDWLRFNQFYKIDKLFADVLRKYAHTEASNHYGLFTALGAGINTAFSTTVEKTIDTAADSILTAVGDKLSVDEGATMKILTNNRINGGAVAKALASRFENPNTNNNQVMTDIDEIIISRKVDATYLILPGHTLQSAEWEALNVEASRSSKVRGTEYDYRGKHNAVIGDSGQVRRIALA